MILGRYLLTAVVMDVFFPQNVTIGGKVPYEVCSAPMVDVSNYDFFL